jgi:hypothetical protein
MEETVSTIITAVEGNGSMLLNHTAELLGLQSNVYQVSILLRCGALSLDDIAKN